DSGTDPPRETGRPLARARSHQSRCRAHSGGCRRSAFRDSRPGDERPGCAHGGPLPAQRQAGNQTAGDGLTNLLCAQRSSMATSHRPLPEYRYENLTWPEMNDAIELGKVCIVPCGAVEQHGHHLPLDVDIVCPTGIALGAAREVAAKALVLPTVCY